MEKIDETMYIDLNSVVSIRVLRRSKMLGDVIGDRVVIDYVVGGRGKSFCHFCEKFSDALKLAEQLTCKVNVLNNSFYGESQITG